MGSSLVAGAGVAALGAAGFAVRHALRRSLPQVRGEAAVAGLDLPVRVDRDRLGIPHVTAASMRDAAFAMGYVHGQDRLWQLDFNRRVACGRISEMAGRPGIEADRFVRRVGLLRLAEAEARLLSPEAMVMLTAYSGGINAAIDCGRPLPLEFALTRVPPEPWRPVHCLAITKLIALGLSVNWEHELQRLELVRALGPRRAARLELVPKAESAALTGPLELGGPGSPLSVLDHFQEVARWFPTRGGCSNSWVVSGARTASGRPLLCNDPHLPPSTPGLWYAAHVRAGDDFESTGATIPGMPFPIIGHNRRCAWGYTNSFVDAQDLVIEQFEDGDGTRYRTEAGPADTLRIREVIRVRGAPDVVEEVLVTRHGPVVQALERSPRETWLGLALQWTANRPAGTADGLLRLQRSHDWESFRAAFRDLDAPSQNVVYADVDGHIGYLLSGRVPVRNRAPSPLPIPGWTGDARWTRYLRPDEVPQILDPPDHVIVTANNRLVGDGFPHYLAADYMNGYRAGRIRELLDRRGDRLSAADMAAIQLDLVCPPARQVVALLRALEAGRGRAEGIRSRLAAWDGVMVASRTEPTLYEAFMRGLARHALTPLCGPAWTTAAGTTLSHALFGYPGNLIGRLTPLLLDRWSRGDEDLFEGTTSWREVVWSSLADAAREVRGRRPWGRVHAMPLQHRPLASARGLGRIFGAGTLPVGGDTDTVLATSFSPAAPYRTTLFAPSWRQIIDVGDWDSSTAVHLPGQSGQLGSSHRRDLMWRWQANRQFGLHWSAGSLQGRIGARLTLRPAPAPAPARRVAG